VETVLRSSAQSWLQTGADINPDFELYPEIGFPVVEPLQSQPLAVAVRGEFQSAYRELGVPADDAGNVPDLTLVASSPATARMVVFGSAEFLNDTVFSLSSQLAVDRHLNSIQLVQNAISWCVEDLDLLQIRARGTSTRMLLSLDARAQAMWEWLNYGVALLALLALALAWRSRWRHEAPLALELPVEGEAGEPEQEKGGECS